MSESTERPSRTVATLLNVIAFGGFVDLRVELLFCPRVAVRTAFSALTFTRVPPLITVLHRGTRQGSVFVFVRAPPAVFAVVIVGTCIALTAQPRRFFAKLSLVVREHETVVLPAWIFTQDLLYECSAGHDS